MQEIADDCIHRILLFMRDNFCIGHRTVSLAVRGKETAAAFERFGEWRFFTGKKANSDAIFHTIFAYLAVALSFSSMIIDFQFLRVSTA